MKSNGWTYFNEQEWEKWKKSLLQVSDLPNMEPFICKFFGCGATLTLEERLCGDFCQLHSHLPKNTQPCGPEDPVRFVSY